MAVARVGAQPVLVDCRPDTYLIDLDQVDQAVTSKTKALIVVHMFGQAVDMAAAAELAHRHGLALIEDCAQAIGARSHGRPVGSTSDAGCWSFAPSKNLAAAGDAGAVSLHDSDLTDRIRVSRHFGQVTQNHHEVIGYNSRLDSMQALVLTHKLPMLNELEPAADRYRRRIPEQELAGLPVSFQEGAGPGEHVYHLFQCAPAAGTTSLKSLQSGGVDVPVIRYPFPLHLQGALRSLGLSPVAFPVAEELARETLCLPLHPR